MRGLVLARWLKELQDQFVVRMAEIESAGVVSEEEEGVEGEDMIGVVGEGDDTDTNTNTTSPYMKPSTAYHDIYRNNVDDEGDWCVRDNSRAATPVSRYEMTGAQQAF